MENRALVTYPARAHGELHAPWMHVPTTLWSPRSRYWCPLTRVVDRKWNSSGWWLSYTPFVDHCLVWWRGWHNSGKLWAISCRVTQDRWVTVTSSDRTWSTGGGSCKPLQYACCENPKSFVNWQTVMTLKYDLPRPPGWNVSNTATREEWRRLLVDLERMKRCSLRSQASKPA